MLFLEQIYDCVLDRKISGATQRFVELSVQYFP